MSTTGSAFGMFDHLTLAQSRDALTSGYINPQLKARIEEALAGAPAAGRKSSSPLRGLRRLLDEIRGMPSGTERIACMNTFVRTLGRPDALATFIDALRTASSSHDPAEAELAHRSRRGRMHCVYGWAGQTLLLPSRPHPTSGTLTPTDDMESFLGYPSAEWDLSLHIWQPNRGVQGFASTKRLEPGVIVEPPHSHPFAFVSYVAVGDMHQTIYREDLTPTNPGSTGGGESERYAHVALERVDGVWPPHQEYQPSQLRTVENRVTLRAEQSYFLPPHAIHDVEIDRERASRVPTVTLFLCGEGTVKPKAYLAPGMAEYHRTHPDLKEHAQALEPRQWERKLEAVGRYLRGHSPELRLDEIVRCAGAYGFMHV